MTRFDRLLVLACVTVMLAGILTVARVALLSESGLGGTTITFSINVIPSERPAIEQLLSRFQREIGASVTFDRLARFRGPLGVKVNLITDVQANDLVEKLENQNGSSRKIQLFAQDNVALGELVQKDLVQPVSGVRVDHEASPSMVPGELRSFFLPFRPNVRLTYARREELRRVQVKPPTTAEELTTVARKLKGSGPAKVTLSLAKRDPAAVTVSELIVSHGGDPLVLNDPGSIEAFTFLQQLWKEGLLARESLLAKYDTEPTYLMDHTSSLAQNWPITSVVLNSNRALKDFHVSLKDFHVYPGWSGPKRAVHVIGGDVLGIPKGVNGRQRKAAVELARFLMSRDSQDFLTRHNMWPSYRDDVNPDGADIDEPQRETFKAMREALKHGWLRPSEGWEETTNLINEAVDQIVVEGKEVRPVLDELHSRMP